MSDYVIMPKEDLVEIGDLTRELSESEEGISAVNLSSSLTSAVSNISGAKAVTYVEQSLTSEQKQQARKNIDAVCKEDTILEQLRPIEELREYGHYVFLNDTQQTNGNILTILQIYASVRTQELNDYIWMLPKRTNRLLLVVKGTDNVGRMKTVSDISPADIVSFNYVDNALTVTIGSQLYFKFSYDDDGILTDTETEQTALKSDIIEPIQPDWGQNDETQLDYIKNRTHYTDEEVLFDTTVDNGKLYFNNELCTYQLTDLPTEITLGEEYTVNIDGTEHPFVFWMSYGNNSTTWLGKYEPGLCPYESGVTASDVTPCDIVTYLDYEILNEIDEQTSDDVDIFTKEFQTGLKIDLSNNSADTWSFRLPETEPTTHTLKVYTGVVKQLDEKYIPYTIARSDELTILPIERLADFGATVQRGFKTSTINGSYEVIIVNIPTTLENPGNYIFYMSASDYEKAPDGFVWQFNLISTDGTSKKMIQCAMSQEPPFFVNIFHDIANRAIRFLLKGHLASEDGNYEFGYDEDGQLYDDYQQKHSVYDTTIISKLNGMTKSEAYTPSSETDVATKGYVDETISSSNIFTSPNGTRYQIIVNDDGTLSTEQV